MKSCDCPPYDCAAQVRDYLEGNRQAGDELASKFTPLVVSLVRRVLGPERKEDWEDACQTIFLHIFTRLDSWQQQCPFCKWLAVVAARRAIDLSRTAALPLQLSTLNVVVEGKNPPVRADVLACMEEKVARFPPEWQKVFELARQGHTPAEIATQMGCSVRSIYYWLAGIRDQLQGCLD